MTTLQRKPVIFVAAIVAAVVLAFGILCAAPATAVADDTSLSAQQELQVASEPNLSTQATVKIPVITKMTSKTTMYVGGGGEETVTETLTPKYNANGQIKSYKDATKSSMGTEWSNLAFTFNKNGAMKTAKYSTSYGSSSKRTYTLDKKKRVKKIAYDSGSKLTCKYNSKGYASKVTGADNTYTWNADGQLQKIVNRSGNKYGYTYDAKGNVIKRAYQASYSDEINQTFTYTNTYGGGLLKKRVETNDEGDVNYTTTFKYKTVKVPKAYASQVKAQQKWLKLNQMTFAFYNPPLEAMYK